MAHLALALLGPFQAKMDGLPAECLSLDRLRALLAYLAELQRMRGELLVARDGLAAAGEALACFDRATRIGREQGALAWELRAAMSLVRLRERQGEACTAELAEARNHLRDVYGRFTEGFAFPDLVEARALFEQLDGRPVLLSGRITSRPVQDGPFCMILGG